MDVKMVYNISEDIKTTTIKCEINNCKFNFCGRCEAKEIFISGFLVNTRDPGSRPVCVTYSEKE